MGISPVRPGNDRIFRTFPREAPEFSRDRGGGTEGKRRTRLFKEETVQKYGTEGGFLKVSKYSERSGNTNTNNNEKCCTFLYIYLNIFRIFDKFKRRRGKDVYCGATLIERSATVTL